MLEINKIYNMDCMQGMAQFPDKYFDLAIVDPPYGIGEDGSRNHTRGKLAVAKNYKAFSGNDLEPPNQEYFNELFRVSKNQIIWGANHFIERINKNSSCWVVWDKNNGENDFADCELAWTSFKTAVRKFKFTWHGMIQGNMQNKEKRIHQCQKPVALYTWLLNNYAKQGYKILDTHLGSASSIIACEQSPLELDYIGFEIDKEYFDLASKRIADHKAQISMFEVMK